MEEANKFLAQRIQALEAELKRKNELLAEAKSLLNELINNIEVLEDETL